MRSHRTMTLSRLLTLLLGLSLVAACAAAPSGGTPDGSSDPSIDSRSAAPAATGSAPPSEASREVGELPTITGYPEFDEPPTMFELVEDRGDTLLVKHQFGEVEIPADPQRIYVDASMLPTVIALDLPIVGGQYYNDMVKLPTWEEDSAGAEMVEVPGYAFNFEHALAMEPDLIIGYGNFNWGEMAPDEVHGLATEVAPALVPMGDPVGYFETAARDLAVALGADTEEANARILAQREAVEDECEPLRDAIGDETVALLGIWAGVPFINNAAAETPEGIITPIADSWWLYGICGLEPPSNLRDLVGLNYSLDLSIEMLPSIEADHIFLYTGGYDDEGREASAEYLSEFMGSSLYQAMPAVQNGQAYVMEYFSSYSFDTAMEAVIAAVEALEANE